MRRFLPFNPCIEVFALEAPLPPDLECGETTALCHPINRHSTRRRVIDRQRRKTCRCMVQWVIQVHYASGGARLLHCAAVDSDAKCNATSARAHQGKARFSFLLRRLPLDFGDAKAAPGKGKSRRFKALRRCTSRRNSGAGPGAAYCARRARYLSDAQCRDAVHYARPANLPLVVAIMAFMLAFGLAHMRAERARAAEASTPRLRKGFSNRA